jgi:hypothetical protein
MRRAIDFTLPQPIHGLEGLFAIGPGEPVHVDDYLFFRIYFENHRVAGCGKEYLVNDPTAIDPKVIVIAIFLAYFDSPYDHLSNFFAVFLFDFV